MIYILQIYCISFPYNTAWKTSTSEGSGQEINMEITLID